LVRFSSAFNTPTGTAFEAGELLADIMHHISHVNRSLLKPVSYSLFTLDPKAEGSVALGNGADFCASAEVTTTWKIPNRK
jgi:hypothetical protein